MEFLPSVPSLGFTPNFLSYVNSWHKHLPFGYDMVSYIKPKLIVELGVHYGDSYFTFCQAVKEHSIRCKCFGIDTWVGDSQCGLYEPEVFQKVKNYNVEHYKEFSTLIQGTFSDCNNQFSDSSIDLLHIDGFHTYEAVKEDFTLWLPKVSPKGIILIHDIAEYRDDFGAWKLWKEIKDNYPSYSFTHGHGLGVIQNINNSQNINSSHDGFDQFLPYSLYYEARGEMISLQKENKNHNKNNKILEQSIIAKDKSIEVLKIDLSDKYKSFERLETENSNTVDLLKTDLDDKNILIEELKTDFKEIEDQDLQNEHLLHSKTHENVLIRDKLSRMQNSFSWRATSLLRLIRRKLIDPFVNKDIDHQFDAQLYLDLNPDLNEIIEDLNQAKMHFKQHGKSEGRQYVRPPDRTPLNYQHWVKKYDTPNELFFKDLTKIFYGLEKKPLLSLILPVYEISPKILSETIESVKTQIYSNWELIIVDDNSNRLDLKRKLIELDGSDNRIKVIFRDTNGHISKASNTGIQKCRGQYILFLDHDDLLRKHSLLRFAQVINTNLSCKFIYSDEDKINAFGKRVDPYFKPDWNPDLLLSQNYICHLTCIHSDLVRQVSGFREGFEGCQDWDLFLRVTELLNEDDIIHIPEVLYHWRKGSGSTASGVGAKKYVYENSIKTVESALERREVNAKVELTGKPNNYIRVKYQISEPLPLVSIVIPTRDHSDLLRVCVDGILNKTTYHNYEILILDNESEDKKTLSYFESLNSNDRIKILKIAGEFNYSKINNEGVKETNGDLILLLNNDIEPINDDWLTELVSLAERSEIGCVGSKLLYPCNTIQHGGVVLGLGGLAGHAFKGYPSDHKGYKNRLNLVQNYSAVTAACLMVKKELFERVNGFNEEDLIVAFNDVDLCLKINKLGFRNLWTPYALLYHHESASRGDDLSPKKQKRFQKEADYIKKTWKQIILNDPCYNVNLTLDREDFSIGHPR